MPISSATDMFGALTDSVQTTTQTVRIAEMCADYQNCNPHPVRNFEIRFSNVYFERKDLSVSRFMLQSETCKVAIRLSM